MNCNICKKNFTGIECYRQHLASEKHKKNMLLNNGSISSESASALTSDPFPQIANPTTFPCMICDITFKTLSEFTEHSQSQEHAVMILVRNNISARDRSILGLRNNPAVEEKDCDSTTLTLSDSVTQASTSSDSTTQAIRDSSSATQAVNDTGLMLNNFIATWQPRCEKCDKNFSGPEPYQQHINSIVHKKKCGLLSNGDTVVPLPTSNFLICKLCNCTFSGPVPYQDHMRSMKHKKKELASSYNTGEKIKENASVGNLIDLSEKENALLNANSNVELVNKPNDIFRPMKWYCEVCNIQCSGVEPYQQHMASRGHAKKSVQIGAQSKQDELRNLFSGQPSCVSQISNHVPTHSEIDGACGGGNSTSGDMGHEVKNALYGNEWDVKTCTPENLDLTFFGLGEEIDFDKDSKVKVEVSVLDMVDVNEEENEEMEEE